MDKNYRGLQKSLIAILGDLKRMKKHKSAAIRYSEDIGGPLKKETAALMSKFDKLAQELLKLEQETREI